MSQEINNRAYRKEILKGLILQLHEGKELALVQEEFAKYFSGVSANEIAEVEQALLQEGMAVEEIQQLCDVHAAVFKGSIEEIHRPVPQAEEPGHPLQVLKAENRALEALIQNHIRPNLEGLAAKPGADQAVKDGFKQLQQLDLHYLKKENLLFPYLEKYGITAPPKVMWGVDDEIREMIKQVRRQLDVGREADPSFKENAETALVKVEEMIFKEENILFPMLLETLTLEEWQHIREEFGELGYCLLTHVPDWKPAPGVIPAPAAPSKADGPGRVVLPTGVLKLQELTALLNTLPIDLTFVDKEDTVKYFSQGTERIFPRTKAIIGRKVVNCHPPASMHIVETILKDFQSGKKNQEDFWIKMGEKYILIRYFSVRDEAGAFLGTLEVTQNIAPIQAITGEKRLLEE